MVLQVDISALVDDQLNSLKISLPCLLWLFSLPWVSVVLALAAMAILVFSTKHVEFAWGEIESRHIVWPCDNSFLFLRASVFALHIIYCLRPHGTPYTVGLWAYWGYETNDICQISLDSHYPNLSVFSGLKKHFNMKLWIVPIQVKKKIGLSPCPHTVHSGLWRSSKICFLTI